jgi:hypothetical protein
LLVLEWRFVIWRPMPNHWQVILQLQYCFDFLDKVFFFVSCGWGFTNWKKWSFVELLPDTRSFLVFVGFAKRFSRFDKRSRTAKRMFCTSYRTQKGSTIG